MVEKFSHTPLTTWEAGLNTGSDIIHKIVVIEGTAWSKE